MVARTPWLGDAMVDDAMVDNAASAVWETR